MAARRVRRATHRPVRKVLWAGRSGYLGSSPRRAYSPLKNLPFRSRPISANLVVDVLAASDTSVKPGSVAVHSMVAEHSWYSPAYPFTKSLTLRSAVSPLHSMSNETVAAGLG